MKKLISLLTALVLLLSVPLFALAQGEDTGSPDYTLAKNWIYHAAGAKKQVDVFFAAPTVDLGKAGNTNMDLGDTTMKEKMLGASNMVLGIFSSTCRCYSPYYRQVTMPVYSMTEAEKKPFADIAYGDVKSAFDYYIRYENNGRPFMLAGFSQGAELCLRLMKEEFGDGRYDDRFVAAYLMGWRVTDEDLAEAPHLKLAEGADDLGKIVVFDCEAAGTESTLVVPEGVRSHCINPLNWKTDATPATKEENPGSCFTDYDGNIREIPNLCGAYIDPERGTVIVTDITPEEYPAGIDALGEGSYHIYDYQFFFRSLQENVKSRTESWLTAHPAE